MGLEPCTAHGACVGQHHAGQGQTPDDAFVFDKPRQREHRADGSGELVGAKGEFGAVLHAGEADEVGAISWIPVSKIDEFEWAFEHDTRIKELIKELELV